MSDVGPSNLNPAAFIAGLIGEDVGVTEARGLLRSAGMNMSNQAFSSLYGQVRAAIGERDALQGLDYSALPSGDVYSTWAAGRGGQYVTFTETYLRSKGERDVQTFNYFHMTDVPHTPQEAIDAAQAIVIDAEQIGTDFGERTVLGSVVTSVNRTVARSA